jgi:hypothetical protein
MKYIKKLILFALLFSTLGSFAQSNDQVEMADVLRQDGKIYTVVLSVVIILTAMIVLLIRVDKKIFRIEESMRRKEAASSETVR